MSDTSALDSRRNPVDDLSSIQERAVNGVFRLGLREVAIKLIQLLGGIMLARALPPEAFGLFAIAYFVVNLFAIFSELGLGAAYIRKPGAVSSDDLDALFWFQLVFVGALSVTLFLSAPAIGIVYREPGVIVVVRALSISLVLISLRTVPIVISERRLSYGPIAFSDICRHTTFWTIAVLGAIGGLGVWSLVTAVVASTLVASAVLFGATGWRPSFTLNFVPIRKAAGFGVLYQGQTVAHFAKDNMIPALGGIVYGGAAVGFLTWAQQLTAAPLALTNFVARVSYPALAKLQADPKAFGNLLESTLRWTCRISFPIFAVMIPLTPAIIGLIYGAKWRPATLAAYVFYANMVLSIGTGVLMPGLYSMGRARTGLRLSLGWMALTWVLAAAFAAVGVGFEAIAAAYLVGTIVAIVLITHEVRKIAQIRFASAVLPPFVAGVVLSLAVFVVSSLVVRNLVTLMLVGLTGITLGIISNVWRDRVLVIRSIGIFRGGNTTRSPAYDTP